MTHSSVAPHPPDLLLRSPLALLPEGWCEDVWLQVAGGFITGVTQGAPTPSPTHPQFLPGAVIPGLPNLHSHGFQRAMAGRGESDADSFWGWRNTMYRLAGRMGPDAVEASTALAYLEMVEAGFTSVGEFHYLHHGRDGTAYDDPGENCARIMEAAREVGIGLTLLPVFYAHSDFAGAPPLPEQAPFVTDLDSFHGILESALGHIGPSSPLAPVVGLAPHSLRAVAPEHFAPLLSMAPKNAPIHIHVAEQEREVEGCLAWSGARPVEWLLERQPVDERWCLVHATHMTAEEVRGLARSGAVAGLCPVTEANLGDGIFPAVDHLGHGGAFGVGSDSNIRICPAEELRSLEYSQRLRDRTRVRIPGPSLLAGALTGGAQALAQPVGALAPGMRADLVVLDLEHPTLFGSGSITDPWIFAGGKEVLREVWVAGIRQVESGRHPAGPGIRERYRRMVAKWYDR